MISKHRIILFLIVLAMMLLVKYAVSQEVGQVGWDYMSDGNSSENDVYSFVEAVIAVGSFLGVMRASLRHHSFNHGGNFEPEMIRLRLS
jgi:hypothetical protein